VAFKPTEPDNKKDKQGGTDTESMNENKKDRIIIKRRPKTFYFKEETENGER
jgi:hypothetical protein